MRGPSSPKPCDHFLHVSRTYPELTGIPSGLTLLVEEVFDGLPIADGRTWMAALLQAMPEGGDLDVIDLSAVTKPGHYGEGAPAAARDRLLAVVQAPLPAGRTHTDDIQQYEAAGEAGPETTDHQVDEEAAEHEAMQGGESTQADLEMQADVETQAGGGTPEPHGNSEDKHAGSSGAANTNQTEDTIMNQNAATTTNADMPMQALQVTVRSQETIISARTGNPWIKLATVAGSVEKTVCIIGQAAIDAVGPLTVDMGIMLRGRYDKSNPANNFIAEGPARHGDTAAPAAVTSAPRQPKAATPAQKTAEQPAAQPAATQPTATQPKSSESAAPAAANDAGKKGDTIYSFTGTASGIKLGRTKNDKSYAKFTFVYIAGGLTATRITMAFGDGYENIKHALTEGGKISLRCRYDSTTDGKSLVAVGLVQTRKAA